MKILLAIPCYNCEIQITRVIERFNNEDFKDISEIVFINNKSKDNTKNIIIKNVPNKLTINSFLLDNKENYPDKIKDASIYFSIGESFKPYYINRYFQGSDVEIDVEYYEIKISILRSSKNEIINLLNNFDIEIKLLTEKDILKGKIKDLQDDIRN